MSNEGEKNAERLAFEEFMRKADQFAAEFPWVRYADAPQPTAEEYARALRRGTEIFGREMEWIKTPRDYDRQEEAILAALGEIDRQESSGEAREPGQSPSTAHH